MTVLSQSTEETATRGEFKSVQDPDSLEWVRKWVSVDSSNEAGLQEYKIPCQVRSIISSGVTVAGTTEIAGKEYKNVEIVKAAFPANYYLTQNDRVTNIRDSLGKIAYLNEEQAEDEDESIPTVFKVQGVSPVFDAFNVHVENFVVLTKAEVQ